MQIKCGVNAGLMRGYWGGLGRMYFQIHIFQVDSDAIERTEKVHSHAAVMLMQILAGRRIKIHLFHAYRLVANHKRCTWQE